jgi:RNA 2',3'-cyclic 3'-phosphodiesterase
MNVIRLFIAISLSDEVHTGLEHVIQDLKNRLPGGAVRWVQASNIHLTIKFLGDVSVAGLEMLTTMFQTEAAHHQQFEFSVGGIGAFPSPHRPRVIWVGVEAPAELSGLQHGMEAEMARLGYAPEERPFSPHLTIGRVARNADPGDLRRLSSVLETFKVGFLGVTQVKAIHLFRSDLQPGGAVYTRLHSAALNTGDAGAAGSAAGV